jgi:putative ABC transport system substrate-binding protein
MRRRDLITLISFGAAAWPFAVRAQQTEPIKRIGVLVGSSPTDPVYKRRIDEFKATLRDIGWPDTKVAFVEQFADGKFDRLPALAAELVKAKMDLIVTVSFEPAVAARDATTTIPIVMAVVGDAVGTGLALSLAHPGGNVTGLTLVATEQSSKRLELIKEALPNISTVAVFSNPNNASHRLQLGPLQRAATTLGLRFQSILIEDADKLDAALDATIQADAQAILTLEIL